MRTDLRWAEGGETTLTLSDFDTDLSAYTVNIYLTALDDASSANIGSTSGTTAGSDTTVAVDYSSEDPGLYWLEAIAEQTGEEDLRMNLGPDASPKYKLLVVIEPQETDQT